MDGPNHIGFNAVRAIGVIFETLEVDLHRIELRFADARLLEPRAVEALARSIEQSGQLIACIAVPEEANLPDEAPATVRAISQCVKSRTDHGARQRALSICCCKFLEP